MHPAVHMSIETDADARRVSLNAFLHIHEFTDILKVKGRDIRTVRRCLISRSV